ncbi:MAG: putative dioxygenase [Pseudobdellovibrio sp.]|jgi:all-trans-8'-apo-beta-carotenal 15,15'-oxygenase|nr:putative dioxygenase [Pseudobdellovibrio sp.]
MAGLNRPKEFSRRDFIKHTALASTLLLTLPNHALAAEFIWSALGNESRYPVSKAAWDQVRKTKKIPYDGLVTSLNSENHYECEVRGELPADLNGTLLRNGPGLFERGNMRRRMVIDGDGMVRRFQIKNGKAFFTNRHIRTEKFRDEEKAGRYIYPSFAMLVPKYDSMFTNSVAKMKNQASVTTFSFGGRVFATDEVQPLTELHPVTLQTIGEAKLLPDASVKFMAHYRITNFGQKRLHLLSFDPLRKKAQVYSFNEQFQVTARSQQVSISQSFHDWHVTPEYFVFLLPPLSVGSYGMVKAVAGLATIADAMSFNSQEKAKVLILPKDNREAKLYALPHAIDSWHAVNAYQEDSNIVFDFVASRSRPNTASNKSPMARIMRGEILPTNKLRSTTVDRVIINYETNQAKYTHNRFGLAGIEMPTINQALTGRKAPDAYFVRGLEGTDTQVAHLNLLTGEKEIYDFGPEKFTTEPIVAPGANGKNYLLSEVFSYKDRKSYLAVFDAANISRGPICEIWLRHHLPIGFHGFWKPG